jgi:outer membrane protein assembly factor BamB
VIATRKEPLPESSDWSHNGANAANTGASQDRFVKAPLSRLWFDGSFRWIKTPGATIVRVAGDRVFVGAGNLQAIDVYTGRHLWQVAASPARPSDDGLVVVEDAIYLANGKSCAVLNPASGEKTGEINLPSDVGAPWSIIRVIADRLVGACGNTVVCVNRDSGSLLWKRDRESKVGCLALGGDKVFCADFVAKRRGEEPPDVRIEALDLRTGKVLWQAKGGWEIRYSEPYDLLCSSSGVFRGGDGTFVRDSAVSLVADDKLICGGPDQVVVLDARTGNKIGEQLKWNRRGCTVLRGSSNLLTTRYMGNASYIDLATGQITSIWNVRAACSNNLFVANGVLNAPGLTLGCT